MPVQWACRIGVYCSCETGLILGTLRYRPDPVEPPANGNLLVYCSQPYGDIVLDLKRIEVASDSSSLGWSTVATSTGLSVRRRETRVWTQAT